MQARVSDLDKDSKKNFIIRKLILYDISFREVVAFFNVCCINTKHACGNKYMYYEIILCTFAFVCKMGRKNSSSRRGEAVEWCVHGKCVPFLDVGWEMRMKVAEQHQTTRDFSHRKFRKVFILHWLWCININFPLTYLLGINGISVAFFRVFFLGKQIFMK